MLDLSTMSYGRISTWKKSNKTLKKTKNLHRRQMQDRIQVPQPRQVHRPY